MNALYFTHVRDAVLLLEGRGVEFGFRSGNLEQLAVQPGDPHAAILEGRAVLH